MDILLPGKDGLTMTRELRARSDIGIILVSQKNDDIDRIVGLEIGADDYVCKPFNPRELLARVKSLLRRRRSSVMVSDDTPIVRFGSWQFDLHGRTLLAKDGTRHRLTSGEYQLLATLIQHPGKVLSRERLQSALSSNMEEGGHRSVDVLIGRLRRKLNDDARNPALLVTVHGEGYIFSAATY